MPKTAEKKIQLNVAYKTFLELIEQLSLKEKFELWELLDRELADMEDELMLKNPKILKRIQESKAEVEKGHYIGAKELEKMKGR